MTNEEITPPTKDTRVKENDPDNNYGSETTFLIQSYTIYDNRALLEFDISSIPSGATITVAELRLYCVSPAVGRTYEFRRVTGAWEELDVTWNNQPAITETNSIDHDSPTSVGWYNKSVLAMVQDARAAGTTFGVRIKDSVESGGAQTSSTFRSKEYTGTAYDPILYVEYTPPTASVSSGSVIPTLLSALGLRIIKLPKIKPFKSCFPKFRSRLVT